MVKIVEIKNIEQKNEILEYLKESTFPEGLDKNQKRKFKAKVSNFSLLGDVLCFKNAEGQLLSAVLTSKLPL